MVALFSMTLAIAVAARFPRHEWRVVLPQAARPAGVVAPAGEGSGPAREAAHRREDPVPGRPATFRATGPSSWLLRGSQARLSGVGSDRGRTVTPAGFAVPIARPSKQSGQARRRCPEGSDSRYRRSRNPGLSRQRRSRARPVVRVSGCGGRSSPHPLPVPPGSRTENIRKSNGELQNMVLVLMMVRE